MNIQYIPFEQIIIEEDFNTRYELGELDKIFAAELKPFKDAKVICIEQ